MNPATAKLRRFTPVLIIMAGFVLVPLTVQKFFSADLRTTMFALNDSPRVLPPLSFQDETGHTLTLDRFRGQFVLLNFWATWCPPCKQEMPSLNALAGRLPANELTIVPVSIDTSGAVSVSGYYKSFALDKLTIYADPASEAMRAAGVVGIPTTLLIGRDGREIARLIGPAQWDAPAIVEGLTRIVAPP